MTESAQHTSPALAVGTLFQTAPRALSALFAVIAVTVVGSGIIALF